MADEALHEGSRFTTTEIGHAAEYLAAKQLINGVEVELLAAAALGAGEQIAFAVGPIEVE